MRCRPQSSRWCKRKNPGDLADKSTHRDNPKRLQGIRHPRHSTAQRCRRFREIFRRSCRRRVPAWRRRTASTRTRRLRERRRRCRVRDVSDGHRIADAPTQTQTSDARRVTRGFRTGTSARLVESPTTFRRARTSDDAEPRGRAHRAETGVMMIAIEVDASFPSDPRSGFFADEHAVRTLASAREAVRVAREPSKRAWNFDDAHRRRDRELTRARLAQLNCASTHGRRACSPRARARARRFVSVAP